MLMLLKIMMLLKMLLKIMMMMTMILGQCLSIGLLHLQLPAQPLPVDGESYDVDDDVGDDGDGDDDD